VKRYRLSAEAENDLDDIMRYLMEEGGGSLAGYVLRELRNAIGFLTGTPGAGHVREDLTEEPVKFWSVFSYMIVYDPATKPLGVARIVHGGQDLERLFRNHPPRA
jgi:plasmid stabilization system protein ParE